MKYIIFAIILFLTISSCGPYSFSGTTLTDIKSIYVPVLDNQTIEYGISEELTDKITTALVADNTLKVVGIDAADAYISGQVISYKRSSETYNKEDQVSEYRVDITVSVKFSKADGSLVWEDVNVSAFGLFEAETETEEDGKSEALDKIAEIIVNKTVRNW